MGSRHQSRVAVRQADPRTAQVAAHEQARVAALGRSAQSELYAQHTAPTPEPERKRACSIEAFAPRYMKRCEALRQSRACSRANAGCFANGLAAIRDLAMSARSNTNGTQVTSLLELA